MHGVKRGWAHHSGDHKAGDDKRNAGEQCAHLVRSLFGVRFEAQQTIDADEKIATIVDQATDEQRRS